MPDRPSVVISVGGSILLKGEDDLDYIHRLSDKVREWTGQVRPFIVVGGGRLARQYIGYGRDLGADETYLDNLGIAATRMNAHILLVALGDIAPPGPAHTFEQALHFSRSYPVVVMGGTHPGHTTDAVSAFLAERVRAVRFVNATNVEGVFTADPRTDPDARLLDHMSHQQLWEMVRSFGGAGMHVVIDSLAAKTLLRSRIPARVVDGRDLLALEAAVLGREGPGTRVDTEG
jgi:uridylate kinase